MKTLDDLFDDLGAVGFAPYAMHEGFAVDFGNGFLWIMDNAHLPDDVTIDPDAFVEVGVHPHDGDQLTGFDVHRDRLLVIVRLLAALPSFDWAETAARVADAIPDDLLLEAT